MRTGSTWSDYIEQAAAHGEDESGPAHPRRRSGSRRPGTVASDGIPPPPSDGIAIVGGEAPRAIRQIEDALIAADRPIYLRGSGLVRPIVLESTVMGGGSTQPAGALVLEPVVEEWVVHEATALAKFYKFDARSQSWRRIDCPPGLVRIWLALAGQHRMPRLVGTIEAPTLRPDGSVLSAPGYDAATGLYLHFSAECRVAVPDRPTRRDAVCAAGIINDILSEFAFADAEIDLAVAASAMITAPVRRTLPTAPAFVFDSSTPGSGKTTAADLIAIAGTGRRAPVMSYGTDDTETEKRLGAFLRRAYPVINIDNVDRPIGGDMLAAVLSSTEVGVRPLGETRVEDLPTNALIVFTGNNVQVSPDIVRRVLLCRLDPRCERPEQRRFSRNIYEYAVLQRPALVSAALTILRAYHVAGRPSQCLPPYGGYEHWSDLVRSAMVWCGYVDPLETRTRLESSDPVTGELGAVLPIWDGEIHYEAITVRDLLQRCKSEAHADLRAALLDVAATRRDPGAIDPRRLSHWLRRSERRVVGGLRLERGVPIGGRDVWRVVRVDNAERTP